MQDAEQSHLPEREKMVVQFATLLVSNPHSVTDTLFERLRRHFPEDEILEIALYTMYMNLHHCYLTAFQKEPPDGDNIVVFEGPGSSIHWSTAGSFQPDVRKSALPHMARPEGVREAQVSRLSGESLAGIFEHTGGAIGRTYLALSQSVWNTGTLDLGLKEMLRLKSAQLAGAGYALQCRLREAGLDEAKLAMVADPGRAPLSEHEKLALQFAELLITTPASITDSFFEEMQLHFTQAQLVELCYFTLTQNILHRVSSAIGLRPPSGTALVTKSIHNPV